MSDLMVVLLVLIALACGVITYIIAFREGLQNCFGWVLIGLCLGPVGVVLVIRSAWRERKNRPGPK